MPPALAAIIDRALAKDVAQRYQDGNEMARDLRDCLQAGAAGAKPDVDINL